jgi:predicted ATPase
MARTPGPWKVRGREIVHPKNDRGGTVVIGPDYKNADELNLNIAIETYRPPKDEDMAFIVRACNAHDGLLAACKGLLDFIQTFNIGGEWCQDNYPAIKAARAVIAQAEVQG